MIIVCERNVNLLSRSYSPRCLAARRAGNARASIACRDNTGLLLHLDKVLCGSLGARKTCQQNPQQQSSCSRPRPPLEDSPSPFPHHHNRCQWTMPQTLYPQILANKTPNNPHKGVVWPGRGGLGPGQACHRLQLGAPYAEAYPSVFLGWHSRPCADTLLNERRRMVGGPSAQLVARITPGDPILCICQLGENLLVTGTALGRVSVWDRYRPFLHPSQFAAPLLFSVRSASISSAKRSDVSWMMRIDAGGWVVVNGARSSKSSR